LFVDIVLVLQKVSKVVAIFCAFRRIREDEKQNKALRQIECALGLHFGIPGMATWKSTMVLHKDGIRTIYVRRLRVWGSY
jgi:hypothetical protein